MNDVYCVREPSIEGNWWTVVRVYDGHMVIMPHVYSEEEAKKIVATIKKEVKE